MRQLTICLLFIGGMGACSTQDGDWTKNVSARQITADTALISVRGNAFASTDGVRVATLREAARITLADGYAYFLVVDAEDRGRTASWQSPGFSTTQTTANASALGGFATGQSESTTVYTPGQTYKVYKPAAGMTIRMFREAPAAGSLAFSAAEVMRFTEPKKK